MRENNNKQKQTLTMISTLVIVAAILTAAQQSARAADFSVTDLPQKAARTPSHKENPKCSDDSHIMASDGFCSKTGLTRHQLSFYEQEKLRLELEQLKIANQRMSSQVITIK